MSLVLLKEKEKGYRHQVHDLRGLLSSFFGEFLESFFPEVHRQIDAGSFIQLPSRRKDEVVVYRARTNMNDLLIYVLIDDGETNENADIHKRMYTVFNSLYNMYGMPIIPILLPLEVSTTNSESCKISVSYPDADMPTFEYYKVKVQKNNWRNYLRNDNVVAAALLYQMDFPEFERMEFQMEILQMLGRLHSNPSEHRTMYHFFSD